MQALTKTKLTTAFLAADYMSIWYVLIRRPGMFIFFRVDKLFWGDKKCRSAALELLGFS